MLMTIGEVYGLDIADLALLAGAAEVGDFSA